MGSKPKEVNRHKIFQYNARNMNQSYSFIYDFIPKYNSNGTTFLPDPVAVLLSILSRFDFDCDHWPIQSLFDPRTWPSRQKPIFHLATWATNRFCFSFATLECSVWGLISTEPLSLRLWIVWIFVQPYLLAIYQSNMPF